MELQDKTAIVTGATAGIGVAVAEALHAAGCRVLVTGRRAERLEALAARLPGTLVHAGELTDPALPQALLDKALAETGRCDIFVSNAGILTEGGIEDIDVEAVCEMVRVNTEAAFRIIYTALRHFKAVGTGHMVNTSSVLGTKVRQRAGAYCGTKHAVEALSEALRMELAGTDVRISCVEPGLVETEMHRNFAQHPKERLGIKEILAPEDVARAVLFVLRQPPHIAVPKLLMIPAEQEI